MKKVFYNKLIRDNIPAKMDGLGKAYEVKELDEADFERALLNKIGEEANGVVNSQTREELVEELADLQAVIEQIKESRGIATQEMDEAVRKGMEKKGGFTRKLWLVWSEDDGYRSNEGVDLAQEPVPELSADAKSFRLGRYRHYKGGEYEAIAVGRHSETLEEIVVYKALYGAGSVWVRPLAMFIEDVEVLGNKQRRFVYMN